MITQPKHSLTFKKWLGRLQPISTLPLLENMENYKITKGVSAMLKDLAKKQRPSKKPEDYLEQLICDLYKKEFRK